MAAARTPPTEHGRLARVLLPPLVVLIVVSTLVVWQVRRLVAETASVDHTDEVLARGNALYRRVVDQETGLRGYLLTGRDEFLEPYRAARDEVTTGLSELSTLVAENPLQLRNVERLREDHAVWQHESDAEIAARAGEHAGPSAQQMIAHKREMDGLRSELQVFLDNEDLLRRERTSAVRRETRASFATGLIGLGLLATGISVGARRRLADVSASYARVAAAESRLRRLWESNIVGVMYAESGGRVTDANLALLRMVGYTREDLEAGRLSWTAMTPPEQLLRDEQAMLELSERGACAPYEKTYIAKDGRRVPVIIGGALLEGSYDEHICFVVDLTEQKRAEQAAAEQHAIVRTITDTTSAALFMEDERGCCTFANPAAEAMTGYTFDELKKGVLHDLIHRVRPDGSPFPREECAIVQAMRGKGRVTNHEAVFIRKDGTFFPVVCTASPVSCSGVVSTLLEVRDVTEQKRIEREREMLLDSERAARSAAERAAHVKDEFLAVLSHELRTPLAAILGWASLLRKGQLDPTGRARAMEVIERNALAEAQLVEDLLDVSRIASGKVRLNAAPLDPADVVAVAVDSIRPTADAKQIRIEADLPRGVGPVQGDAGRLQQVVWNLLSNAVKFTPRGGHVRVAVRAAESSAEIVVGDDGPGICADFLPHIFERFRQADSSTTRCHGGLGLGLALVRSLVEMHGGTVRAESEGAGRGATFTVSLPVSACRAWAHTPAFDPCVSLEGVRVLVVDDEPDSRELLRRLLADCRAEVVAVESAREALDELPRFRPDVLLSDLGMPQQDGYQLVRAVRALDEGCGGRTPAAAVTALVRPEDRRRALRAGYQMHLAKPIDATELLAAVARLAGRACETRDAGAA